MLDMVCRVLCLNAPRIGRGGLLLPLLLVQLHMSMLLSPLVALQVWLDCGASRGEAGAEEPMSLAV